MSEDPFRFCVYCRADCYEDEPEHAGDCPSVTNVWPVTEKDLGMRGPDDPYAHGMGCVDCGEQFKVGDSYSLRTVAEADRGLPGVQGAAVCHVICLGCAAAEAFA